MTMNPVGNKHNQATTTINLPVIASPAGAVRPSRMSRRRAISLVLVHVVMIAHVLHWLLTGRTLSPIEPSEAMYTLNNGEMNAGFIFFALALAGTLIAGRFVCGWGCHLVAYQDLCAWLLKKCGIKPKPLRSRLLVLAPLALAIYMFIWPSAYRWWMDLPVPELTNHLLKTAYWETFPGPIVAVLTLAICGFGIVYFLGSKGFCTYACPYGGFFSLADKVAPGRILVTDACQHCGHCTATCTSNVRIHEEVALYGMVVDPGCMKCMDCVTVCPNDALYFGFAKPSILARLPVAPTLAKGEASSHGSKSVSARSAKARTTPYDFSLLEEVVLIVVGLAALLSLRGLYGQIPLLLAMGLAGMIAYLFGKLVRLARTANVRFQNLQLKLGGRLTRVGNGFAIGVGAILVLVGHSGVIRYNAWRGGSVSRSAVISDSVWQAGNTWWTQASAERRRWIADATKRLERVEGWGLLPTRAATADLVWLYLAQDRDEDAETALRRLIELSPDQAESYRGLAGVLRKTGRIEEADAMYRQALAVDPTLVPARNELASMHYAIGMTLIERRNIEEAIRHLERAVDARSDIALYHYNLGVATFMAGRPLEALPHIREASRLDPDDPDAKGFERVIRQELDRK